MLDERARVVGDERVPRLGGDVADALVDAELEGQPGSLRTRVKNCPRSLPWRVAVPIDTCVERART